MSMTLQDIFMRIRNLGIKIMLGQKYGDFLRALNQIVAFLENFGGTKIWGQLYSSTSLVRASVVPNTICCVGF